MKRQLRVNDPVEMKIIKKALGDLIQKEIEKFPMPTQMRSIYLYQKVSGLLHVKPLKITR